MLVLMSRYPQALQTLIAYLKKLPGVGRKTAERFAFEMLEWPEDELRRFSHFLATVKEKIQTCTTCGCLKEGDLCSFCTKPCKDPHTLCILSSSKDVYLFEETASFCGFYHVLGTLLSPLDGKTPKDLGLEKLIGRLHALEIKEVILALDATLEGETTALYLKEQLFPLNLRLTRLALGLPLGSTLDYIDKSTLAQALFGRQLL